MQFTNGLRRTMLAVQLALGALKHMIDREMIEDLFERTRHLKAEGRVRWDIDEECRWSFFFFDASPERLTAAGEYLQAEGYEFVGILAPERDEDEKTFFARVDKVERHSVDSLLQRNTELYAIAERLGIEGYDGMDVGAIDGP